MIILVNGWLLVLNVFGVLLACNTSIVAVSNDYAEFRELNLLAHSHSKLIERRLKVSVCLAHLRLIFTSITLAINRRRAWGL
jgi:hypothetical protein